MVIPTIMALRVWLKLRPLVIVAMLAAMSMFGLRMPVERWQKQITETLVGVGVAAGQAQKPQQWQSVGQ